MGVAVTGGSGVRAIGMVCAGLVLTLALGSILGIPLGLAFVETGSMAPTMHPSDGFVAVPPAFLGGVSDGDVVTFDAQNIENGGLTTHRVVGETANGYVLRGDANPFTDQQAGEPPVSRDRIVAEALQIGGHVVVIPNLGEYIGSIRRLFAIVGGRFGLGVNQVVAFVLVGALAAYLLDESGAAGQKRTERNTGRNTGFTSLLLVGGSIALVVAAATLSMTAGSGAIVFPYDSMGPDRPGQGGIPASETKNTSIELRNGGIVPMTAVLTTSNPNAELAQERVSLAPRGNASVNVSITAPAEPGSYEVTVERNQYLAVLPVSVLARLSAVSHWLAVAAVDLLLALGVGAIGAKLVGGGRLRLRPTRAVPFETGFLRWVRSLYRGG